MPLQCGECEDADLNRTSAATGSDALNRVGALIKRFVSLSDPQAIAVTLWVAHTHALDAAETTPYLCITSAEKQCGKTRLLEVLSLLVARPWLTGSASKAVLVRKVDAERPTLLLDESDAAFAGNKEYSEALRAVLNNGHSRGGVASLCVGQGTNIAPKDFQVFCPKAIAGIGRLPDTVADRSIPIRMKRRAPNEQAERFRRRLLTNESADVKKQLCAWIANNKRRFSDVQPELPESLSDRQQDGCEPLLAIADVAGGDWPERVRNALLEILTGEAAEDYSTGVRLLSDIRNVFELQRVESLSTRDLLAALCDAEPQWSDFSHGKPLSDAALARLLKRYGIHHRKLRLGERTAWGYNRSSFEDAWARYMPRKLEQVEQSSNDAGKPQFVHLEHRAVVPARENAESPVNMRVVPDVPVHGPDRKLEYRRCYVHGDDAQWWEQPPIGSGNWVCGRCHPPFRPPTAKEVGFD
jgi:hypothetical protein